MSKARSPRDVCSTTIGTRGLMVLASVRRRLVNSCRGSVPTARLASGRSGTGVGAMRGRGCGSGVRRPELVLLGRGFLLRGPQLLGLVALLLGGRLLLGRR